MEVSPQSGNGKLQIVMIVPCQEFDYGFMKYEIQSPESPVKAPMKAADEQLSNNKILYENAVKRMEKKAVGFILASAVKSDLDQPKVKNNQEINKKEAMGNSSPVYVESQKEDQAQFKQSQVSQDISRIKDVETSRVNYTAKLVYRSQFEASPPDWIGVWEGKTRKFGLPPNTSVLRFAFMGGVLSRLDDKFNSEQVVAAPIYQKYQVALPNVIHRSQDYENKEILISPEEYRGILVQTVNSKLYRHWRRNSDICFCKICNLQFSFFNRKHHCRL